VICFPNLLVIGSHNVTLLRLAFKSRKVNVSAQHADNEIF